MEELISISNPKVIKLASLDPKSDGVFLVEGPHLVEEARKAKLLLEVYAVDEEFLNLYKDYKIFKIGDKVAHKLSKTMNSQNVFGLVKIKEAKNEGYQKVLLLDDLQDPGNMGTLIRSAAAFGIEAIYASPSSVSFYNDKTVRASQGAIFKVDLIKSDLKEVIASLKEKRVNVIGTSVEGGIPLKEIAKVSKYAILLGNEAKGVKKDLNSLCDLLCYIPMEEDVESLNVSVAGSIIMWGLKK